MKARPQSASRSAPLPAAAGRWPLRALSLTTPRLVLRWPSESDLDELADLAAAGVHDPAVQPFEAAWTDVPPDERALGTLQFHWSKWAAWKPDDWQLLFVVVLDGTVVGSQGIEAHDFAVVRELSTGSWLGLGYQGRGIGTEMRAAVLSLAFEGLGAQPVTSEAFTDNAASLGVSRRLGYQDDGIAVSCIRGRRAVRQRLRLDRARWQQHATVPVELHHLEPCLALFGVGE
jgi:RimJ/RimL family protein N-acetyltransferase